MTDDLHSSDNEGLIRYRLDELQKSLTSLTSAVSTLSSQIMTLQVSLPDRFLTRLEFAESLRQKELQQNVIDSRISTLEEGSRKHVDALDEKTRAQDKAIYDLQNQWHNRAFSVIGIIFTVLVSAGIGIANLIKPGQHIP